ncbi:MAG: LysM peptidoglycan-binding domain-containing protein [Puniceicoccales bacterium]|jgi:LysM repeat protein|nr:LysM peptidoglycan-binding domain-containing protein [Puniceicoccales bacterium]
MILRKIIFGTLLLTSFAFTRTQRNVKETIPNPIETEIVALRTEVSNLAAVVGHLQTDVEVLKLNTNVINEEQKLKIEKIAEEVVRKNDPASLIDQEINTLSSAFSKEINGLSEKIQNVLNRIITVLNTQQKLTSTVAGTLSKQPEGIAYEVKAGETLDGIAIKHGVTRDDIKKLNFISDENNLTAGQMLFIPQKK